MNLFGSRFLNCFCTSNLSYFLIFLPCAQKLVILAIEASLHIDHPISDLVFFPFFASPKSSYEVSRFWKYIQRYVIIALRGLFLLWAFKAIPSLIILDEFFSPVGSLLEFEIKFFPEGRVCSHNVIIILIVRFYILNYIYLWAPSKMLIISGLDPSENQSRCSFSPSYSEQLRFSWMSRRQLGF